MWRPATATGAALTALTALNAAGQLFPVMFALLTISGVVLLLERVIPLTHTFMAPVLLDIAGYHVAVDPGGVGPGGLQNANDGVAH